MFGRRSPLDPDGVIVCTQDHTHAEFIVQALEAGKRVYCEKPLCTTAEQCRRIVAAAARSPGEVFVTHNMRYGPVAQKLKELVDGGKIGRLLSLQFDEFLDRSHGADFFRRWHRRKESSGGLLIHKASHHFDTMNWLVGSWPAALTAMGGVSEPDRHNAVYPHYALSVMRPATGKGSTKSTGVVNRNCGSRPVRP